MLADEDRELLRRTCREAGIELRTDAELPKEPQPGLYLAAGYMQGFEQQGELLRQAWAKGLYRQAVSEAVPGPGRGLVSAVLAPRGRDEHCIALLGGDPAGLREAVREFVKIVRKEPVRVRSSARRRVSAGEKPLRGRATARGRKASPRRRNSGDSRTTSACRWRTWRSRPTANGWP